MSHLVNKKTLRAAATYAALAVGVSVGGVAIGAIVVAPAVSRATPLFSKAAAQNAETIGTIGQADGDGALATSAASVVAAEPFKPMTEALAAAKEMEATANTAAPRRSTLATIRREAGFLYEDALDFVGGVPKITWVYVDVALVALFAGVWFYRRRNAAPKGGIVASAAEAARRSTQSLPTKLVPGKGSRTPKAVAALAEAGTAPADIARHTGLSLDAVAMLLSLGSFGVRQLQPPSA